MLALRLARGSRAPVLLSRLLLAAATAAAGFLLLTALCHALAHPGRTGESLLRLLWCLPPAASVVHLAAALASGHPEPATRDGLDAAGLGPARLPVVAATTTAIACLLGSVLALLVFLHLRGDLTGLPFDGAARDLLAADRPLPLAATLTLLAATPVAAALAAALTLRDHAPDGTPPAGGGPGASALPWGVALVAAGIALTALAGGAAHATGDAPLHAAPGVVGGWLLGATGLALAGPGLVHRCGRLLSTGRPGVLRLLAGRGLQAEAPALGQPLGVLCAVGAGTLTTARLHEAPPWSDGPGALSPLAALGCAVVLGCALLGTLTALTRATTPRATTRAVLRRLGAPRRLLRGALALRATALLLGLAALSWALGTAAALPLSHLTPGG
ncbi:hypothetical protein E0L36_13290 [Streptomyces sp. AJS327]|uniref:hypothetical protein n=1 Tax=Streptomyces sp. AJS327 TaxID=2545265 RepID=UPI0015DEFA48|nr:hypothetical protein [Streptomyces sp. AJS327]MBA0051836.1 hypothetical protein [Streptomyces sp. AJS327]